MSFLAKVLGLTFLAAPAPQHGRHLTSRLSTGPEPSAGAGSFGSFGAAHAAVVCGGGLLLSAKSRPRRFGSGGSLGSLRRLRRLPVQRAEAEAKATGTKEMPKALVVNLDRSPARWESAKEEFSREGLTVERFSGTDGRALSHADLRKVATWSARWFCTKGMLGCFLSHRRIWQKVVDEKLRAVIVLEDDVRLVKDFNNRLLKLLDELPDDWEVCLLGAVGNINSDVEPFHMKLYSFCVGGGRPSPGKTRKISPGVFVPHRPAGTHAYMVSQKGAQRLLKDLPKACYHVDLTAWALPDLKLYCAVDQLATQDFDAESTVSKAGQSRTQRFLKWSWAVTGLADMGKKGGVPNPEWAWKAAMFAIPVPLSGGKRIAVELGPTSAAWVVLLLTAALRRSKTLLAIAIMYQGTGGAICRYLANTRPYLFFLAHCALAAASLHFLP